MTGAQKPASAGDAFGKTMADRLFAGRKGHGGAPVSYMQLSREEVADIAGAAFDMGVLAASGARSAVVPTPEAIEKMAVKHEAFGFGQVDAKGLTTHGFDPIGLQAFVYELFTQQASAAPEVNAAWNEVRRQARAIAGAHGLGDLLAAVEDFGNARAAAAHKEEQQ